MGTLIERLVVRGDAAASERIIYADVSSYDRLTMVANCSIASGTKDATVLAYVRGVTDGIQSRYQSASVSAGVETLSDWSQVKECTGDQGFHAGFDVKGITEFELHISIATGAAADIIMVGLSGE